MFREKDRVRFIDVVKNDHFGVLIIYTIKGDTAVLVYGDFSGQIICNAQLSELKYAE